MFNDLHFGYQIGPLYQALRRTPTGADHFHGLGPQIQQAVEFIFIHQGAAKRNIDFIQYQDIGTGMDELPPHLAQTPPGRSNVCLGNRSSKQDTTAELTHLHTDFPQHRRFRTWFVLDELDEMNPKIDASGPERQSEGRRGFTLAVTGVHLEIS